MKNISKKIISIFVLFIIIMKSTMEADAYIVKPESQYSTKELGSSYATFCLTLYSDAVTPSITTGVIADCYIEGTAGYVDANGTKYIRYIDDSYAQCASWGPRYYLYGNYMFTYATIEFSAYDDDGNMATDTLTRALTVIYSYTVDEDDKELDAY